MEPLCPGAGLASGAVPGQGLRGETRLGRPSLTLWAASPSFVVGRPCDCPGVPRARIRSCRFARLTSGCSASERRFRCASSRSTFTDFCEVAIAEDGQVRRAGRVETTPARLELFARSLAGDDQVALEATGNAVAIARIIEPHVDRVVLANPKAVKNATQSAKTDKLEARTLARLLAAGF